MWVPHATIGDVRMNEDNGQISAWAGAAICNSGWRARRCSQSASYRMAADDTPTSTTLRPKTTTGFYAYRPVFRTIGYSPRNVNQDHHRSSRSGNPHTVERAPRNASPLERTAAPDGAKDFPRSFGLWCFVRRASFGTLRPTPGWTRGRPDGLTGAPVREDRFWKQGDARWRSVGKSSTTERPRRRVRR